VTTTFARKLQIFLPFALGYFLSYLYRTINAVLAPDLAADIGVDPSGLGLLTSVYFITFGVFQLPLGVLLDRFGPRRIEAALLLVAAAGALVFSQATTLTGLVVGRGLIGFGVSACLMAAFKGFVMWFPLQQLPRINGFQMAAGGLGAIVATAPVEAALSVTDWRGVFAALAVFTLVVAAGIFFVIPKDQKPAKAESLGDQLRGIRTILSSLTFWRIAPLTTISQAAFLSIQGLWAGPWLRDVAGFERPAVAAILLAQAVAMMAGFIILGVLAERLGRRGIPTMTIGAIGMALFMVILLLLAVPVARWSAFLWVLFGFLGSAGILVYAALSQSFPAQLSGRVNTAMNLLVFVAAFIAQWGMGTIIGRWPIKGGGYAPSGYQTAFIVILVLQAVALAWYWLAGVLLRRRPV
jgi:predicted MFS family arabinose efflux permease